MRIRFVSKALAFLGLMAVAGAADAQSGTITGKVTQSEGGAPIAAAQISVNSGMTRVSASQSGEDGSYRIANVPAGTYTVVVTRIGFAAKRTDGVQVNAGATTTLNVGLAELAAQLNQVVTTATRGAEPEKILDSPNSISVVSADRIAERPSVSITDHIKTQPGLSISNGGIVQANIVSRGFNNAFSTSMLMLQDYRFAGVPSLRVNVPFRFPGTGDDIDRIEVLQGPASALYGPNSGAGVMHVITKSPFSSQGTSITLDGGERSMARVGMRHAGTFGGNKFGYKLSGEYFTADDWQYTDPNEVGLGFGATVTPEQRARYGVWGVTPTGALDPRVPASRQGVAKSRNFDLEKYSGEARLDWRPNDDTEAITTLGYSMIGSALEITTTFGAAQVQNWSYSNLQQRFRHKKFFAQVFYNASNAGNDAPLDDNGTFYLRSGIPVVDQSNVMVAQLQQGFNLKETKFTAGFDYIATTPQTKGTIMGRNEDDDNINEMGAYLQMTHPISDRVDFTGAVRGDMNSRIEGTQFSPRFAFIFKQSPTQNWRLTYNRAFNSPASFSFFLDQFSGNRANLGPALGNLDVQILGNQPKTGWNYDRSCDAAVNAGLCMRSPFTGPAPVSAQGANMVPGIMATFAPQLAGGLAALGLPAPAIANIQAALLGLAPTNTQVRGVLRNLGAAGNPIVPWTNPVDLSPLGADFSNTWEIGYKGVLNNKLRLAVDFWYQIRPADPTTQVINLDDAVFLDPATLGAYLGAAMGPTLVANGVPAPAVNTVVTNWVTSLAALPAGLLNFDSPLYDRNQLVFTYQNAIGQVDVRGIDLAADYLLTDVFSVSATYSNLNRNVFEKAAGASVANPLTANAAKNRATLTFRWDDQAAGRSAELRTRYTDAFPVNSGVYNSYNQSTPLRYEGVPVNWFVDAGFSTKLPIAQNVRWSINAQNILDVRVPSFIGVPDVGRFITTRISYNF
ncbi:MAG: TonB-dependent receptor [Gemmatimonadaceae bacterium]|nr:TonB-dependent receptor [Gemmatimonadaceae bacterium]